jgi:hypothetical protein
MTLAAQTMTSAEASRLLGVTSRQIQRLADSGRITIVGHVGRTALLDTNSVLQLRQVGVARGRAWNEATIWSAIALLDGAREVGIDDASSRWHLRNRLRNMTAEQLVRVAGHRATIVGYRASASQLRAIGAAVMPAGTSALDYDGELSQTFGLAQTTSDAVDGYVSTDDAAALEARFFLTRDHGGNVTFRLTKSDRADARIASVATVAIDLAESLDTRQRSAGLRVLRRLLGRL